MPQGYNLLRLAASVHLQGGGEKLESATSPTPSVFSLGHFSQLRREGDGFLDVFLAGRDNDHHRTISRLGC